MVFGSLGEMSSNVKDFVDLAADYGAEHLGKSMAALTLYTLRKALKRRVQGAIIHGVVEFNTRPCQIRGGWN